MLANKLRAKLRLNRRVSSLLVTPSSQQHPSQTPPQTNSQGYATSQSQASTQSQRQS